MALVTCKEAECGQSVSEQAEVCPHCGVRNPGVSYEEERLAKEIDEARKAEQQYMKEYMSRMGGFLKEMLNRREINHYVELAKGAQGRAETLRAELFELQRQRQSR